MNRVVTYCVNCNARTGRDEQGACLACGFHIVPSSASALTFERMRRLPDRIHPLPPKRGNGFVERRHVALAHQDQAPPASKSSVKNFFANLRAALIPDDKVLEPKDLMDR